MKIAQRSEATTAIFMTTGIVRLKQLLHFFRSTKSMISILVHDKHDPDFRQALPKETPFRNRIVGNRLVNLRT